MRMKRPSMFIAAALMGLAAWVASPGSASAQINGRNFYVGAGAGFGLGLQAGGQAYFRGEETVGYHVLNVNRHPGLYLGLTVTELAANLFGMAFAADVGFDILLWDGGDKGLLLTPSLGVGLELDLPSTGPFALFHMHPALAVSLSLLDGLVQIFFRPLGFDIGANDTGAGASYSMMAGVKFNF